MMYKIIQKVGGKFWTCNFAPELSYKLHNIKCDIRHDLK